MLESTTLVKQSSSLQFSKRDTISFPSWSTFCPFSLPLSTNQTFLPLNRLFLFHSFFKPKKSIFVCPRNQTRFNHRKEVHAGACLHWPDRSSIQSAITDDGTAQRDDETSPRFQPTLGKGNGTPNRKQKRFPRFRSVSPWQKKKARGERAGVFFWLISPFHVDVRNPPSHGSLFDSTLHELRRPDDESIITQIAKGDCGARPFPYILSSSRKRKKKRENEREGFLKNRPSDFPRSTRSRKGQRRFF